MWTHGLCIMYLYTDCIVFFLLYFKWKQPGNVLNLILIGMPLVNEYLLKTTACTVILIKLVVACQLHIDAFSFKKEITVDCWT